MVGDMRRYSIVLLVLSVFTPDVAASAADSAENEIRSAFQDFQISLVPMTQASRNITESEKKWIGAAPTPELADYLVMIADMAYGKKPFDAMKASFSEALGVYITRFSNICPFLVASDQSKPLLLEEGLPGALEFLPSPGTVVNPWASPFPTDRIVSIKRDGDTASASYRWSSQPKPGASGSAPAPISFDDRISLRLEGHEWRVVFQSYKDMIDRHWVDLLAGTLPGGAELLAKRDVMTPEERNVIIMKAAYVFSNFWWDLSFNGKCMAARERRGERLRTGGTQKLEAAPPLDVIANTPIRDWQKIFN